MTRDEFRRQPFLMFENKVIEVTGFARVTLEKHAECGVLAKVKPKGSGQARYQKRQIAQLIGMMDCLDLEGFKREPMLMQVKAAMRWTGYAYPTLQNMVQAKALTLIRLPGGTTGKFRKVDIARLIGCEECL